MGTRNELCNVIPRTFCAPLHGIADCVIHRQFPIRHLLSHLSARHTRIYIVFTPSFSILCLSVLPRKIIRFLSVYQWGNVEGQRFWKKIALRWLLRRSEAFAVFDRASLERLDTRKPVAKIGVCVDFEFFKRCEAEERTFDLIVVGSHCRHEPLIREIAEEFSVARVTQNVETKLAYEANPHRNVEVFFSTSYESLRSLYCRSRTAVIPVVATEVPVGITAYYEAIAMELPIVARYGPSTGGFLNDPCTIIVNSDERKAWIDAIRLIAESKLEGPLKERRRNAMCVASVEGLTDLWRDLLKRIGAYQHGGE